MQETSPSYSRQRRWQIDWAGNAGMLGLASAQLFFLRVSSAILICMTAIASATTYYIDQTVGSDSNNGTSEGTPWKNAPGMRAVSGVAASTVLKPGDTVYFDRGDTWLVSAPADGQGLYLVGGVTYLGDSWGTGERATIRASGDLDCGVVRFRDSATNPTIFKGFDVDANKTISTGIDINHANYSLMTGATKRVENVIVRNVFSNGSLGQYKYGIIVSNWGGDRGVVENVEILDCTVHDTSRAAIALYPGPGVLNRIGNILVRGCEAYNTGQDPSYLQGHGIVVKGWVYDARIENNYVHVDSGAVVLSGPDGDSGQRSAQNVIVRNNILTAKDNTGIIRLYNPGAKDIKIYGNLVFDNGVGGGLNLEGSNGSLNLLVYNNTFHNAFVNLGGNSSPVNVLEFKNNVVQFASPQLRNSGVLTSQSNNILTSGNPGLKNPANKPTGFVGTYGVDLAPNADGFSLIAGSAAIDTGADLGSGYNGSINSIARPQGSTWDIGAYEYMPIGTPSPPTDLRIQTSKR